MSSFVKLTSVHLRQKKPENRKQNRLIFVYTMFISWGRGPFLACSDLNSWGCFLGAAWWCLLSRTSGPKGFVFSIKVAALAFSKTWEFHQIPWSKFNSSAWITHPLNLDEFRLYFTYHVNRIPGGSSWEESVHSFSQVSPSCTAPLRNFGNMVKLCTDQIHSIFQLEKKP